MNAITGSGGRMHAVEQAESLHHLADELWRDLRYWGEHIPDEMHRECSARIERLRLQAREQEMLVIEYDRRRGVVRGWM